MVPEIVAATERLVTKVPELLSMASVPAARIVIFPEGAATVTLTMSSCPAVLAAGKVNVCPPPPDISTWKKLVPDGIVAVVVPELTTALRPVAETAPQLEFVPFVVRNLPD